MILSKAKLGKYSLLRHKKYRDKDGLFMVQGVKAVEDTIGKFTTVAILCSDSEKFSFLHGETCVYEISDSEMRRITSLEKIPDIIAIYKIPVPSVPTPILNKNEFYLAVDGVQDPGNLGTMIRSAHWFGIKKMFCSRDTVDVYNPKVVMATMGSIAAVDVEYCDLNELFLKNQGIPVYGMLLEGKNIFSVKNLTPGFIVMGSEGHGLSESILSHITIGLTIPPVDPKDSPDSLNVAIATAIALSQLVQ